MVRVLLFHYFKTQQAFCNSLQPSTLTATKEYLFLATGAMKVYVYALEQPNFPLFCQFPTISKAVKLVCNEKARCVVTIERKIRKARSEEERIQTFSRAYFNWFEANQEEAVRTYVAGYSLWRRQEAKANSSSFLALEIPAPSVSAISCCPTSGNIAVASENKVSLYRWRSSPSDSESTSYACCSDMEHFIDIDPSLQVKDLVLSDSYIAFRSNLEVQVLKLVFVSERKTPSVTGNIEKNTTSSQRRQQESMERFQRGCVSETEQQEKSHKTSVDDQCITWSFDECPPTSSSFTPQWTKSNKDVLFPTIRKEPAFKDFLPDPKEVLGPVSEVAGKPVVVSFAGLYNVGITVDGNIWKVKGMTMLYRRFRAEQLSNNGSDSAILHSLQLLPTYTQGLPHFKEIQRSPLVPRHLSDPTLCGMCCLVSSPKEGYMYDVLSTSKLLSYYKYTCDTLCVSVCNGLLHAVTLQGLETYTVRLYALASEWIRENEAKNSQYIQLGAASTQNDKKNLTANEKNPAVASVKDGNNVRHLESNSAEKVTLEGDSDATFSSGIQPLSLAGTENDEKVVSDLQSCNTGQVTPMEQQISIACAVSDQICPEPHKMKTQTAATGSCHHSSSLKGPNMSPSDVKLTVDNSGRTLVRFTTGSKSVCGNQHLKGIQEIEPTDYDSESNAEVTDGLYPRSFGVGNPLSCGGNSGTRVSESFYKAAVKKLSNGHGWTLPVCDLKDLRQHCPCSSLDICLIGMYPFVGAQYLIATEGGIILFTRAPSNDHSLQRSKSFRSRDPRPLWESGDNPLYGKVYILHNMDYTQLYKAVMPLANRCQKHNVHAYHHLVCEQHFFLRTLCLVDASGKEDKKRKKLKKLLCESAANLAELFGRTPNIYKDCAQYYIMSGLPLREILDRAWKSGFPVSKGLIHFLDQRLLGSNETVSVSECTAKRIFKLYSKGKPSRVAEIILMSSLNGFSPDTALAALEDLRKPDTSEVSPYRLAPLDNLARAVLYLHRCEPDHAREAVFSIPKKKLVEVLATHYHLLHEEEIYFTPLAQLLRKLQPKPFLETLLNLYDTKVLPLDVLLGLLGVSKSDAFYNDLAIGFLEAVLSDKKREESFGVTVIQLCKIYLERIDNIQRKCSAPSHKHIPSGGHFAVRHLWLNKLPPFQGSLPAPIPGCPCFRPVSPQGSSQLDGPTSLFTSSSRRTTGKVSCFIPQTCGKREECSCCCCNEDLVKLQALLCSEFVSSVVCTFVLDKLDGQTFRGVLSLKLLCLPHVGRYTEAITTILEESPMLMLPYGIQYFNHDVGNWSHLLQIVLDISREENSEESDLRRPVIIEVLKGTLQQLSRLTTPIEFLALLPNDGAIGFFLPYLQWCHRRFSSNTVSFGLMKKGRQTANLTKLNS